MAAGEQGATKGTFPPALTLGCRVWTDRGYLQHGPVDGPKQDIRGPQGGEIVAREQAYPTIDCLLYSVRWDNGQTSKHYAKQLFSIGRFKDRETFEAAFELEGDLEMRVGPRGGFRSVRFRVRYDGQWIESETSNPTVWRNVLEPAAVRAGRKVIKVKET